MKRILFVSIAFPPKNDPECLQAGKYFKYMVRENVHIDVITSAIPTLFMPYDRGLVQDDPPNMSKIEIPVIENRFTNFVLRKVIPGGINYPDSKFTFHWQSKSAIRQIPSRPDVIYSRSNPLSSAVMAWKIQRHYQVPWVMHLSDPWVGSPVVHYSKREYQFNEKWERRCFDTASRISFTTEKTLDFYKERYPDLFEKFFICPNVFDPEEASALPLDFNRPFRIVYTGGLAGNRSAEFFLNACAEAYREDPGFGKSEIIFAGPVDHRNKKIFEKFSLSFVTHIGEVSYPRAIILQQEAHLLLTIDQPAADPAKAMFFPSKIPDYFLAKRLIVAITSSGSSTEKILSTLRSAVFNYGQADALKKFLINSMKAFSNKDSSYFLSNDLPTNFSAPENSSKLVSILRTL